MRWFPPRGARWAPCAVAAGLSLAPGVAAALDLRATGTWMERWDTPEEGPRTCPDRTLELSVTAAAGEAWRVEVRRRSTGGDLLVSVRRDGGGWGPGAVREGESWQDTDARFAPLFSGSGTRTGVPVSVRVAGVELDDGAYATLLELEYRVVSLGRPLLAARSVSPRGRGGRGR